MQYFWLNKKEENKKLILFFNGWAMNETPVKHLACEGFDVLMVSDYRSVDFDFSQFNFNKYDKKYLICWSMGVLACNLFYDELNCFDKKIAINGTLKMIDDNYGIPSKIYKITTKFLNKDSCDKFIKNMFDSGRLNPSVTITRTVEELREELIAIQKIQLEKELEFDKVLISSNDKIVPVKNQIAFWENRAHVELIESTHCPFEIYKNWTDLIC